MVSDVEMKIVWKEKNGINWKGKYEPYGCRSSVYVVLHFCMEFS